MNITTSIEKIKGLLNQLSDATAKIDVDFSKSVDPRPAMKQNDDTLKAVEISQAIIDESILVNSFLREKAGLEPVVVKIIETVEIIEPETPIEAENITGLTIGSTLTAEPEAPVEQNDVNPIEPAENTEPQE